MTNFTRPFAACQTSRNVDLCRAGFHGRREAQLLELAEQWRQGLVSPDEFRLSGARSPTSSWRRDGVVRWLTAALGPRAAAELPIDNLQVELECVHRDEQLVGNLVQGQRLGSGGGPHALVGTNCSSTKPRDSSGVVPPADAERRTDPARMRRSPRRPARSASRSPLLR